MIQPQMLFLILWLCLLFYQGTEDMEQPIKYHHIFSALGKTIQETDCVYISHLWGGCISWKQCRIFPSLYSQRRIKNKNPSPTATQNKQKNSFKYRNTLHDEYACGRIVLKSAKNLTKGCSSEGLSSSCCSGLLEHIHQLTEHRTKPTSALLGSTLQGHLPMELWLMSSQWVARALPLSEACTPSVHDEDSRGTVYMLCNLPELHWLHCWTVQVRLENL